MFANKDFVEGFASQFRGLLMTQEVKLIQAAPWIAPAPAGFFGANDLDPSELDL